MDNKIKKIFRMFVFILLAIMLAANVYSINLGVVDGYVFNRTSAVGGVTVDITISSCSGGTECSQSVVTQADGYYVTSTAMDFAASRIVSVAVDYGTWLGGNSATLPDDSTPQHLNITMYHQPSTPSLVPQAGTHDTNVTLSWTSDSAEAGGTGFDEDGDRVNDIFYLRTGSGGCSGTIVDQEDNASSPKTILGLTLGQTYSWCIESCDNQTPTPACASASSTFSITDDPPSAPTLTDEDHSQSTSISFEWTSGIDSEGDYTYDHIQVSTDSSFSTLVYNITNATSPESTVLVTQSIYWWRVKTCDASGCSGWSSDIFFIYICPPSTIYTSSGGSSSSSTSSLPPTIIFINDWTCSPWSSCTPEGIIYRDCEPTSQLDLGMPNVTLPCVFSPEVINVLSKYGLKNKIVLENSSFIFFYEGDKYITYYDQIDNETVNVTIDGVSSFELRVEDIVQIDLDQDGFIDISLKINEIKEVEVEFSLESLRRPFLEQALDAAKERLGAWWIFNILIYLIALMEIVLGVYYYKTLFKREQGLEKKLEEYIDNGLSKGFSMEEIRNVLLKKGWTEEELNVVEKNMGKEKQRNKNKNNS